MPFPAKNSMAFEKVLMVYFWARIKREHLHKWHYGNMPPACHNHLGPARSSPNSQTDTAAISHMMKMVPLNPAQAGPESMNKPLFKSIWLKYLLPYSNAIPLEVIIVICLYSSPWCSFSPTQRHIHLIHYIGSALFLNDQCCTSIFNLTFLLNEE